MSNNGPQFTSDSYSRFAKDYGFPHFTSSPYHPEGNGEAERSVQTIKNLLKKAEDPYRALLAYRSTPLEVGYSPAELLMSRKLRTTLPLSREQRIPAVPDHALVASRDERAKNRQKKNFNARRGAKDLPELNSSDAVWIPDRESEGEVVELTSPRSYTVCTPGGLYRRNRAHVRASPSTRKVTFSDDVEEIPNPPSQAAEEDETETVTPKVYATRSRTGLLPPPIDRLDPSWT